jgi:short-subunit dehydrogenase
LKVHNKTIVVTGGANGIGREIVLLLLKKGARVAIVDIDEAALKETVMLGGDQQSKLSSHIVNITDREAVLRLPEAVLQAHGGIDGLINNAGIIQRFVRINDLEISEIEHVFEVNFWGMVNFTKTFLPYLQKRPEAHIVNISSMGSYLPVPGQTAYGASKAAVSSFTDGLHSELLGTNVHVTAVYPGATNTKIAVNSGVTLGIDATSMDGSRIRMNTPSAAAETIIDGMEKNKYHILVGQDAKLMNSLCRLMPERAAKIIYSQMRSILPN